MDLRHLASQEAKMEYFDARGGHSRLELYHYYMLLLLLLQFVAHIHVSLLLRVVLQAFAAQALSCKYFLEH